MAVMTASCCLPGLAWAKPLLTQDFATSASVSSYVNSAPAFTQFNDISANAAGGAWTVNSGRLQLIRAGSTAATNGAGLTRCASLGAASGFLCVKFDLGVTVGANVFLPNALVLDIGNFPAVTDYLNWTNTPDTFARFTVDFTGSGNYKLKVNGALFNPYPANGVVRSITFYANKSGATQSYRAPDGSLQVIGQGNCSLWLGTVCQFNNVAGINGATSSVGSLRIRFAAGDAATWRFDNFRITDAAIPNVYGWPVQRLVEARAKRIAGNPGIQPALQKLVADANAALNLPLASVLDSPSLVEGQDTRDYYSLAPYWWPDTTKPGGLPWYQDEDRGNNPAAIVGTDYTAFSTMCQGVWTLGLAYYVTGQASYADKAAALTRKWFIDTETSMYPNLNYGQGVPGLYTGRPAGIIETVNLITLTDGLGLIANSPFWTANDDIVMRTWIGNYLDWLQTNSMAQVEAAQPNNHGTWYDAQVAQFALYTGRPDTVRGVTTSALVSRLAAQILANGSQPAEMTRDSSLSYSTFNLRAMYTLAQQAENANVGWFGYTAANGATLRKALDYIAPYANPATPWIAGTSNHWGNRLTTRELLGITASYYSDAPFLAYFTPFNSGTYLSERWQLVRP